MRKKEIQWTETITVFDVGEVVRPTSRRCPLADVSWTVTKCIEPRFPGDPVIVFVEGHPTGVNGEYLTAVQ
jgi:hypothetical protein